MLVMQYRAFVNAASAARARPYPPYSGFKVGAALATTSREVFTGCNMENLAIVTDSSENAVPCGACRKMLSEFNPNLKIVARTVAGQVREFDLANLFPAPGQGVLEAIRRV